MPECAFSWCVMVCPHIILRMCCHTHLSWVLPASPLLCNCSLGICVVATQLGDDDKQRPIRGRQGTFCLPSPMWILIEKAKVTSRASPSAGDVGGAGWHSNMDLLACYPPGCSLFVNCTFGDLSGHPSIHEGTLHASCPMPSAPWQ